MKHSHGNSGTKFQGLESPRSSVTTDNLVDFVQAQALRRPVKTVQRDTGLSKKQVENIRQGLSGVSGKTLTNWCINNVEFAADYAEFIGLILPGEAEYTGAVTRLANATARRQAMREVQR